MKDNNTQAVTVKKFTDETVDYVLTRIGDQSQNNLMLPTNYSPENAVRSAMLILNELKDNEGRPALDVCTKESIGIALYEMVLMGLNPSKKHCYFKIKGNRLTVEKSYFGNIMTAKRDAGLIAVRAVTVYKGDKFDYKINTQTGQKTILEHLPKLENIKMDGILGAYAVAQFKDRVEVDIMTREEILTSWMQGENKGDSPAHRNFPQQMGERTVINRLLKIENASSDDADMFSNENVFTHTTSDTVENQVKNEIKENANKEVLTMDVEHEEVVAENQEKNDLSQEPEQKKENQEDPGF